MSRSNRQGWWALLALLVLCGMWGCAQTQNKNKNWKWPWSPEIDDAVGITTPIQRIEKLKAMREQVAKLSPAEQERQATDLAKLIQREQDPLVRRHVVRTLGYYHTPVAAAVLRAALADTDTDVRIACCDAWGRQQGKEAVDLLSGVLASDTNIDVRLAAARAIGKTKEQGAVAPLAEALVDGDPAIQHRVMVALKEVSGKDFGNDAERWREYAKNQTISDNPSYVERFKRMFR